MHLLVTAGPTREYLDDVRYLSNASSGRMGYAVAAAARSRGHRVTLVSGPVELSPPRGVRVIQVTSAREMEHATIREFRKADALVMTAAVSDYRPASRVTGKIKKGRAAWTLRLVRTPDILSACAGAGEGPRPGRAGEDARPTGASGDARPTRGGRGAGVPARAAGMRRRPICVGFALESRDVRRYALGKLRKKNLDLIVCDTPAAIGRPSASVFCLDRAGRALWRLRAPKSAIARRLVRTLEALAATRGPASCPACGPKPRAR